MGVPEKQKEDEAMAESECRRGEALLEVPVHVLHSARKARAQPLSEDFRLIGVYWGRIRDTDQVGA